MARLRPGTQRKDSISGVDIKNSDQNGPEGQFMTASTTMCNAGSPSYGEGNMISPQLIKVSMKKKKKEKRRSGEGRRDYIGGGGGLCTPAICRTDMGPQSGRCVPSQG